MSYKLHVFTFTTHILQFLRCSESYHTLCDKLVLTVAITIVMYYALAYFEIEHRMESRIRIIDKSYSASLYIMPGAAVQIGLVGSYDRFKM